MGTRSRCAIHNDGKKRKYWEWVHEVRKAAIKMHADVGWPGHTRNEGLLAKFFGRHRSVPDAADDIVEAARKAAAFVPMKRPEGSVIAGSCRARFLHKPWPRPPGKRKAATAARRKNGMKYYDRFQVAGNAP